MSIKVAKFGGTSLADAAQFRKVQAIVQADPQRRYVVPSAPGKRRAGDKKITDMLYLCHSLAQQGLAIDTAFAKIRAVAIGRRASARRRTRRSPTCSTSATPTWSRSCPSMRCSS